MNRLLIWLYRNVILTVSMACCCSLQAQEQNLFQGLTATATDGQNKANFILPSPHFTLQPQQSIHPRIKSDFKLEMRGFIQILRAGQYRISGQASILLDGKEIQGQPVQLSAGLHSILIGYERKPGLARLQLTWESNVQKLEPIPNTVFGYRELPVEAVADQRLKRARAKWEDWNCVACHNSKSSQYTAWKGPVLNNIGSRVKADWLFAWLENPQSFRTNALMPIVGSSSQERSDIAAYLISLRTNQPTFSLSLTNVARLNRGQELYNNIGCGGCHDDRLWKHNALGSKWDPQALAHFLYDPLGYENSGRMPSLLLSREESEILSEYLVQARDPAFEKLMPQGDPVRGKKLIVTTGCLNCHSLIDSEELKSTLVAPSMESLSKPDGCLSNAPSGTAARYPISAEIKNDLLAFLRQPEVTEAPIQIFERVMDHFLCNGCHMINSPSKVSFQKMPPPLTETGQKLRASWMEKVFYQKKRIRPWLPMRMPHFGEKVMQPILPLFSAQSGDEPGEGSLFPQSSPAQIQAGIKLIGRGEGGLSCINCHDFRGERAPVEMRGPDMVEMQERLRVDWTRRWLRDPSRHVPGTAMPAFFNEMPREQGEQMIDNLIMAISAGQNMPAPLGLVDAASRFMLLATTEPAMLRCFMPNSSPRSMAVGLPGKQSYCFDLAECRLRYIWKGDFLDVRPAWTERGGQQPKILGQIYYTAPDTVPVRIDNPDRLPKVRFIGYQLVNRAPEFIYEVEGVRVREYISLAPEGTGLLRKFSVSDTDKAIWLVIEPAQGVKISCSAGQFLNGRLNIPKNSQGKFEVKILE